MNIDFFVKHLDLSTDHKQLIEQKCQKLTKLADPLARIECRIEGDLPDNHVSVSLSCIEPSHSWIGEATEESVIASTDVALDNLMREVRRTKEKELKAVREQGRKLKNQVKNIN